MNILSQKFTVDGMGEFTNSDLVHHFKLVHEIDEMGNMVHPKTRRYVGNLMDYRKKFIKEMQVARNRRAYQSKQAEWLKAMMPIWVDQMYGELASEYGDKAFINISQPNLNFPEVGLKVYIICGVTNRVGFLHEEYTERELRDIVPWLNVTESSRDCKQLLCNGFRDSASIVEVVNQVVEKLGETYRQ